MKYVLLICADESELLPPEEIGALPEHQAWLDEVGRRGAFLVGHQLRTADDATTVRRRNDEVLVADGPFVETKEQIGGFVVLECADLDEAIELAAAHPIAATGLVEVRPVWE